MIRLVVDIAKTIWNPNSFHCFKDPGVSVRECPKSFRAVSKIGKFYMKYRVYSCSAYYTKLLLDSSENGGHEWHKCWSRASYSACEIALTDRSTFEQVGILGIPHNF
jgi:hypothetical protein